MRVERALLEELSGKVFNIGYQGELNHTQVIISCPVMFRDYPDAVASMVVKPPQGDLYPVSLTRSGNDLIWDVSEGDVANSGSGTLQLTFTDGEGDDAEVIKTVFGAYSVNGSLMATGEAPDPVQSWLDEAGAALATFETEVGEIRKITTATAEDEGKALSPKTVVNGKVTEWEYVNPADPEAIAEAVDDWLDDHPEATTTVEDGSITKAKLDSDLQDTVDDVGELKSAIKHNSDVITANLMGVDVQQNLYTGAADWEGFTASTSEIGVSNNYFEGYQAVYSSQTWRRFYKNIPVVAGKTYTFECWLKHNTAGSAFIYLVDQATGAATVSPTSYQFKNQPADTWVKLSLTFTCSASGNVAPYGLSAAGAFYVAKYYLAEGTAPFSLANSLNGKATKTDVSGIGDYIKYSFSETGAGQYWNPEIQKAVSSGTKVRMVFDSYTGGALSWVRLDGKKSDGTYTQNLCGISPPITKGTTREFVATENYVALRVQFARSASGTDNPTGAIFLATNAELGITNDLLGMRSQRVFHVEKDGSGDFTSVVAAIAEACKYMDSIVYIGGGTFELFSDDEFGADYADEVTSDSSTWGMVLKNRVHVIGSAQTLIKATNPHWDDSRTPTAPPSVEYFSVFNTGVHGCTIENVRIEDKGIRYSIHDDQGWSGDTPYINKYINCTIVHKYGMYSDCIGGGLGENCSVEIRGCYFEGDIGRTRLAYYHANNHTGITDAKGSIVVADNYFANDGTFNLQKYGDSTEMTTALVTNNSFGSEPTVTSSQDAQDNMRMIVWNNEVRTS